ncbi:DNA replication licensing factor REC [Episyrphus balteatus]|uniref:DNA replication licensing factor REC n=1 Tax=Episyrphus balteatus TaxID=286459 RepID=UPI002484DB20|nr:DNA replication licensing factor REC [Episyrphus balteatus]
MPNQRTTNVQPPVVGSESRFIRGRGRGSWHKRRPYYFRTGTGNNPAGKRSKSNIPSVFPQVTPTISGISDSLQRNEFFTAPVYTDDQKLQIISIINPPEYSGWRLYFPTETFLLSSPEACHIKAFEKHIQKYPGDYDLSKIQQQQWFYVSSAVLLGDDDFCSIWNTFSKDLTETPYKVLSCLGLAMHSIVSIAFQNSTANDSLVSYKIRKYGIPKINARPIGFLSVSSIRNISEYLDKMCVVHGSVKSIQIEEIKSAWVSFKCPQCGHEQAIRQTSYPTKPLRCRIQCNCKRNFIELRSSHNTKIECVQMATLQEIGLQFLNTQPLLIEVEFREDLVDQIYPGLEITVMGILKMKSLTQNVDYQKTTSNQNYYLEAISLTNIWQMPPNQKDNEIIQMITMEQNCLRLLVQSLAPEMCGYEMVKLAVLLSLFGGYGSQLHDEGELNVLLIGDPGLNKSNLLKKAVGVSGRGSLVSVKAPSIFMPTAQNNSNFIDVGSILTSNSGHCCIDDMEKLSENQENLIHILQTKSIASRSCNLIFNIIAKSAIIAAVNPAGGHYESSKLLRENLRLNPSFISLFHLVFVIYDKADKDRDTTLTEHVKALHSGMKQILSIPPKYSEEMKSMDYAPLTEEIDLDEHLKIKSDEQLDLLPAVLLKKYIDYARHNIKPLLSEEAASEIKGHYIRLRNEKNEEERFSITTRQLEGLILLSQARARMALSFKATKQHALDVIKVTSHSYTSIENQLNVSLNESVAGTSQGNQIKKFIKLLEVRSNALGKTTFEFEELKDMATHAGIKCGVANLIDVINMRGYLLKKGYNLYEFRCQ